MPEFNLALGAISDPILKQIKDQKFKCDTKEVEKFQKISNSISMLRIHSFLSTSVADNLFLKLKNKIVDHLNKQNP